MVACEEMSQCAIIQVTAEFLRMDAMPEASVESLVRALSREPHLGPTTGKDKHIEHHAYVCKMFGPYNLTAQKAIVALALRDRKLNVMQGQNSCSQSCQCACTSLT